MRAADVDRLFGELRDGLVPLIATLREHADRVDDGPLYGKFEIGAQRGLAREVIGLMGFTDESWRFDDAVHPFAAGMKQRSQQKRPTPSGRFAVRACISAGALRRCAFRRIPAA